MKRTVDFLISLAGLTFLSPLLLVVLFLVYRQDHKSPFYIGQRVARGGGTFGMVKIRSMVAGADKTGVESTGASDMRITSIGHFIRRYKIDEVSQLWNVLIGDMSLVGPRPNTLNGVSVYTEEEKRLCSVRPGITDLSSIIFSDEGDILKDAPDPDAAYDVLIRPWKSRLGLLYIDNQSTILDLRIIYITFVAIASKQKALAKVIAILVDLECDPQLIEICRRNRPLEPATPPGAAALPG